MAKTEERRVYCEVCSSDRVVPIKYQPDGLTDQDWADHARYGLDIKEFHPPETPFPQYHCRACGYEFVGPEQK